MKPCERFAFPVFVLGLLLAYIGERAFSATPRWTLVGCAALALIVGVLFAIGRIFRSDGLRRRAYKRAAVEYVIAVAALAVYALSLSELGLVDEGGKAQAVMMVAWPALLLLGLAPMLAVEIALRSMRTADRVELWRLGFAASAARIVVLGVIVFAGVNYASAKWNKKIDLSYFKTTKPGTATLALVGNLTEPVEVYLFYPPGNDVLEHLRDYFDTLRSANEQLRVSVVDQPMEPELARDLKVRNNGYVALRRGERTAEMRIGLDLDGARKGLKTLDAQFNAKLIEMVRAKRVIYFTTGHLERDYKPQQSDKRGAYAISKQLFEQLGFEIKRLGLAEGLGSEIPGDATVVVVAGALEPFTQAERESVERYWRGGGNLLILQDPDQGKVDNAMLAPLGVSVTQRLVATDNKQHLWRYGTERSTPFHVATNQVRAHASTKTLEDSRGRLGIVLRGAGSLARLENPPGDVAIAFPMPSMNGAWVDENGNGAFDKATEKRLIRDFVAAVELQADGGEDAQAASQTGGSRGGRAIVISDADLAADVPMSNVGNRALIVDAMRWLGGNEEEAGTVESEEDIPIVHRKDEDAIWFYGTSFLIPASVLGGGFLFTRRSSQRRRARS